MRRPLGWALTLSWLAVWMPLALAQSEPRASGKSADKIDVSGVWALSVETPQGPGSPKMKLIQDGEKLTGSYRGMFGESKLTGTIKDNTVKFSVPVTVQGTDLVLTYSGTLEKDRLKGTVTFGEYGSGTWSAVRAKNPDAKEEKK